jgi:hypothetical protein
MHLPIALRAKPKSIEIGFTDAIDRQAGADAANYSIKIWSLKRTANYGSDHYDEHSLAIERADVSADGRTVTLHVPELSPTWGMEITCRLATADGQRVDRVIHNSIHRLNEH